MPSRRQREVFWLATPEQMILKLYWEIAQFKQSCKDDEHGGGRSSFFNAFNCAVTVVHCADRAWEASGRDIKQSLAARFGFTIKGNRTDLVAFCDAIELQNRDFYICRRVAKGANHLRQGDQAHPIDAIVEHVGPLTEGKYPFDFVVHDGPARLRVGDVFERMLLFWTDLYSELGYIKDRSGG